jgi:DNA polymerase III psi subunit
MAVIEILTFEVKPGRLEDFLADVRELRQILDRIDVELTSLRVVRYMVAGLDSGQVALLVENTNLATWGQSLDNESQDAADQAISARWRSPDSPARLVNRMLWQEIAL